MYWSHNWNWTLSVHSKATDEQPWGKVGSSAQTPQERTYQCVWMTMFTFLPVAPECKSCLLWVSHSQHHFKGGLFVLKQWHIVSYEVAVRTKPTHCSIYCSICSVCAVCRLFPGNTVGDRVVRGLGFTESVVLQCHFWAMIKQSRKKLVH